jgi:ABC-type branched-subunit amino acid transport system substrate-binding protein
MIRKTLVLATVLSTVVCFPVLAQKTYDTGASDTEIRIGQTVPYSGPASALSIIGRVHVAYFKMINDKGGVNGRKINLISLDDAFSPPKTVEQTRKLVEQDEVLAIVGSIGSPTSLAVAKYLNAKRVPQILLGAGSPKLSDPATYPWTMPFLVTQDVEARIYAQYILDNKPNAKIAILYQNDDTGRNYLNGLKFGLGEKAATMIVKESSYEVADPTIDSQIVSLKASGADTFVQATTPKFTAQAIRKAFEIGWKPLQIAPTGGSQIATVLRPAGLEASTGLLTSIFLKFPGDPTWDDDANMAAYLAFMKQWAPGEALDDPSAVMAYSTAQMAVEVFKNCRDNLTRENLMRQAVSVNGLQLPMFLPGIKIDVSKDHTPWHTARMGRFDGTKWKFVTGIVGARN